MIREGHSFLSGHALITILVVLDQLRLDQLRAIVLEDAPWVLLGLQDFSMVDDVLLELSFLNEADFLGDSHANKFEALESLVCGDVCRTFLDFAEEVFPGGNRRLATRNRVFGRTLGFFDSHVILDQRHHLVPDDQLGGDQILLLGRKLATEELLVVSEHGLLIGLDNKLVEVSPDFVNGWLDQSLIALELLELGFRVESAEPALIIKQQTFAGVLVVLDKAGVDFWCVLFDGCLFLHSVILVSLFSAFC
ncbi:hypothetical protein [Caudoviricetes sp.]|nr:hypothetical protein [Caudoviricetes sp.]